MKALLFSGLFLLGTITFAKTTVLISDIDDTIKRSNILGSKLSALKSKNQFTGMSTLYTYFLCNKELTKKKKQFCLSQKGVIHNSSRWVTYVTGAPGKLQLLGREFLSDSKFPTGAVFGRKRLRDSTLIFKTNKISEIVEGLNKSTDLILIGDNGEHDPEVYHKIEKKYGSWFRKINTYIHAIYRTDEAAKKKGAKLEEGQVPFLTAADLALEFYKNGYIEESELQHVATLVKNDIVSDEDDNYEAVIPEWSNCSEFAKDYQRPNVKVSAKISALLDRIDRRVKYLCEAK